jgi:hypothetical protein
MSHGNKKWVEEKEEKISENKSLGALQNTKKSLMVC